METFVKILNLGFLLGLVVGAIAYDDPYEMERVLDQVVKQNKELQKQMSTITAGLTEMCRAVNIASCDCNHQSNSPSGGSRDVNEQKHTEELKVLSLRSSGEEDDSVSLVLKFEATEGYSLEWMQMFLQGNGMVRTSGNLQKTELMNGRYWYTSSFKLYELGITRVLFVRIYSFQNIATLDVNLTAIAKEGEQEFKDIEYKISRYPDRVIVPSDLMSDFNITIQVDRKVLELQELRDPGSYYSPEYYFTFINTTDYPHKVSERYSHNGISISTDDNGIGDIKVIITLLRDDLENGGLFSISIPQIVDQYLAAMHYGIVIELVREDSDMIAPKGSLAIFRGSETIYVMSSVVSVYCFAIGNPRPDVTILREKRGKLKELNSELLIKDPVTHLRSFMIQDITKKTLSVHNTFVCRATNGNETTESRTVLKTYNPIQFDERKTKVTVNTTKKVVVSCKASGEPRPLIELRLGTSYGPNLLTAEGNFTHKTKTSRDSTKVSIMFAPPDSRFDVLYCFATQKDANLYETMEKEIRLFPQNTDWSFDNWSFYESFRPTLDDEST